MNNLLMDNLVLILLMLLKYSVYCTEYDIAFNVAVLSNVTIVFINLNTVRGNIEAIFCIIQWFGTL